MTRGKWVALAVGVAVIAVLVPYGATLWRAVAYTQAREEPVVFIKNIHAGPIEFTLDGRGHEGVGNGYAVVMRKRLGWLPGPELVVQCESCTKSNHLNCTVAMLVAVQESEAERFAIDPSSVEFEWHGCSCPHPSHAEDSK